MIKLAERACSKVNAVADNIANCPDTAPGTSVILNDVTSIDFKDELGKFCILVTHQTKPGKKTTLTLPKDFGGEAEAGTAGFLKVFAGTISANDKTGVELFNNDLKTALTEETKIEWTAPIATIVYKVDTKKFAKDDGVKIEFEK